MRLKILLLLVISHVNAIAHNSKEAFFVIEQKDSLVEIKAEFPWTLRNALLAFKPELEGAKNKASFEDAFFEYVKSTILLKSSNGNQLELFKVKEVENIGHSHQNNFIFLFRGNSLTEIKNEIMFNISRQQTNYHSILIAGKKRKFTTSINNPKFNIREQNGNDNWWIVIFIVPLLFLVLKKRNENYCQQ